MVFIPLHGEEVHIAVVTGLIRHVGSVEACLTEGRQYALYARQLVGSLGIGWGEDDGDTLVGGVGLGQDVAIDAQLPAPSEAVQAWCRRAAVAIEAPAVGAIGLSEDEDVDLTLVLRVLARGSVAEVLRAIAVVDDLAELLRRQVHVVEDAHRIDLGT